MIETVVNYVLFGMLVAGLIVGADEGVLYVRAEYPESITAIEAAIAEVEAAGYCGHSIAGSDFSFQFK